MHVHVQYIASGIVPCRTTSRFESTLKCKKIMRHLIIFEREMSNRRLYFFLGVSYCEVVPCGRRK